MNEVICFLLGGMAGGFGASSYWLFAASRQLRKARDTFTPDEMRGVLRFLERLS